MKTFKKLLSLLLVIVMVAASIPFTALAEGTLPASELQNLYLLLNDENEQDLKIAYLGGSVTVGSGSTNTEQTSWRALVGKWFVDTFGPGTSYNKNVTNVHAAIGATGSYFGAYRVWQDAQLGSENPPDVLFVEFAINDIYDVISQTEVETYYESIIRQAYKANPKINVIPVFTMDISMAVNYISKGHEDSMYFSSQRKIAEYYGLPQVNVGRALINIIDAEYKAAGSALTTGDNKEGTIWRKYIKDTCHPADAGYAIYANTVIDYITKQLGNTVDHTAPVDVRDLDTLTSYASTKGTEDLLVENGRYISFKDAGFTQADVRGWRLSTKNAASNLASSNGTITTNSQNASFAFKFKGTSVAFFNQGYPESGTLQYTITSLTDPTKVYTGSKSLVKNYTTGLPIPAQIASGLPEDEYVAEFIFVPGEKGVRGELRYIYIDGDIDSVEPAEAPKTILPPIVASPSKVGNWGTSSTATASAATVEGISSTLIKAIAGKTGQYECWNSQALSVVLPENKYVGVTYYYDPGMETTFVPQTTVRLDRANGDWVNGGEYAAHCSRSADAIAGKWVTQYYDFSGFAEAFSGKVVGSIAVVPYGSAADIPADIKTEYIEKAKFYFANAMFSSEMPYIYNEAGEALTVNDGSAIAYVSESGKITVGGKELNAYKTVTEAINVLAPVGGTVKFSGAMTFTDGTLYPKHLNVTIEGLDSSALITNTSIALLGGDIELKNLTITGHNDEHWTYTSGHVLTLGENLTMTKVLRPAATSSSSGKPNLVNIYSGSYGNFAAMAGYSSTFTITGDTIYNIYGGKFNNRIDGVTRDGKGSGKQVHKGDVIYNIYGGSLFSLNTTTTQGTLEGNLIYNINGGKFASGQSFSFGPSQGVYTVNVSGSQAYIINNKEIKENGGSVAGVHIGTKIQNGLTTGNKIVIINNNELSSETGAAISTNSIADYNILVNNGKLIPRFDAKKALIGFEAIPDNANHIAYLGTEPLALGEGNIVTLNASSEIQAVSFASANALEVVYTDGTNTVVEASEQNGNIIVAGNTFTKAGYIFKCWTDNNGNNYYPGDKYTLGLDAVTFTAQWMNSNDVTTIYVKSSAATNGTGLEEKSPVKSLKDAQNVIGDSTKDFTIVLCDEFVMTGYTHYFNAHTGMITITGTENGLLSYESQLYTEGPATFKNIKIKVGSSNNFADATGKKLVFGEGIELVPKTAGGTPYSIQIHAGRQNANTDYQNLEIASGSYGSVYVGPFYVTANTKKQAAGARVFVSGGTISNICFVGDGYAVGNTDVRGHQEWTNSPSVVISGGTVKNITTRPYGEGKTQGGIYNHPLQVVLNNNVALPTISNNGEAPLIIIKSSECGFVDVTQTPGVFSIVTDKETIYINGVLTEKTANNLYTLNEPGTYVIGYDTVSASFKGTSDSVGEVAPIMASAGSVITMPENGFTREGYTFLFWYDGANTYTAGNQYTLTDNTTFTTVWRRNEAKSIYLSADGYADTDFDGRLDTEASTTFNTALASATSEGFTIYVEGEISLKDQGDTNTNRYPVTICGIGGASSAKLVMYTSNVRLAYNDVTFDNITFKPHTDEYWLGIINGHTLTLGEGFVVELASNGFGMHLGVTHGEGGSNYVINSGSHSKIMASGMYNASAGAQTFNGDVSYTFNNGTFSEIFGGSRNGKGSNPVNVGNGNRYYTFNGGKFNKEIYLGSHNGDIVTGNIVFTVNGGIFNGKAIKTGHQNNGGNHMAGVNNAIIVNNASFGEGDNIKGTPIGNTDKGPGVTGKEILIINNAEINTGVSINANSTAEYRLHVYGGKATPVFAEGLGGKLLGFDITSDNEGLVPYANGIKLSLTDDGKLYVIPENSTLGVITKVEFIDESLDHALVGGTYAAYADGKFTAPVAGALDLTNIKNLAKDDAYFLGFKNTTTNTIVKDGDTVAAGDVVSATYAEIFLSEDDENFNFGTIGAQIRLKGEPAFRFVAEIKGDLLSAIAEVNEGFKPESYDETGIGYGYVVIPKDLFDGALTKETPDAVTVPAVKLFSETEEKTTYTVCITNVKVANYTRDYAVVPYITFVDGFGTEHTVYGEEYAVNMAAIAAAALDDPNNGLTSEEIASLTIVAGR